MNFVGKEVQHQLLNLLLLHIVTIH